MRLNQTVHAVFRHVVQHLYGAFRGVGQRDNLGDGTFIRCNTAQASLIQTRIYLLDQL